MLNVRKIAAAVALPVAISLAPLNANAGNDRPLDLNITTPETLVPDIAVPAPEVPDIPTPSISDAYNVENIRETNNTFTSDNSRNYHNSGRTVQVGKVCDEVVIHVANTDRKGGDAIRREIMNILNELGEG